jgi:hypothetical protein
MTEDRSNEVRREKDGRQWRIGGQAEVAWIGENTEVGLAITSAIPPLFEAYATLEHPNSGEEAGRPSLFEDWDRHVAALIAVLSEHPPPQPWWLGFLWYSPSANIIFDDVPKVGLYGDEDCYVLVQAGPDQAATWRNDEGGRNKDVLPDLMFPADRSWLVSTLWDDDWTCIGGPRELVDALLNHPELRRRAREVRSLVDDATPPGHTAI